MEKSDKKVTKRNTRNKQEVAAEKAKEIEELKEVESEEIEEEEEKEERTKVNKAAEERKKTNHKYESAKIQTEEQKEMVRFLIVLLVVIVLVTGIYFLTRVFVTKDLGKKKTNETNTEEVTPVDIKYSITSVGQILNRPYDDYYVLVFSSKGDYVSDTNDILLRYNNMEKHKHIYTVDLNNYINKDSYDPENENPKATKADEFKFGDITLLRIKKGKVDKYITDLSKIKTELGLKDE